MTDEPQLDPAARLDQIADRLREGSDAGTATVRELLSWFGAQRRGFYIVNHIRDALMDAGLETKPDFFDQYIDGPIEFALRQLPESVAAAEKPDALVANGRTTPPLNDPTYRIGKLPAAHNVPVSVKPNDTINTVLTIMLLRDFSYVPVMTSQREAKGVISAELICNRFAAGKPPSEAKDCAGEPNIVGENTSLFDAMDGILRNGYVLVRDIANSIIGIVTAYDVGVQFRVLSEPYLLLSEVENHIRHVIERGAFSKEELQEFRDLT